MKVHKKLFLVFVMAFAVALAGGSALSVNANAQCSACGMTLRPQAPAYAGPLFCRDGQLVPPASYWQQYHNG